MSVVNRINNNLQALYDVVNDEIYKSFICDSEGNIPDTITKPTDIDIGAIASQIEYLRQLSICFVRQLFLDEATGEFLKYQLNEFFDSLQLEDETEEEWVQRTIATVFQHKVSRATIIYSLRPYSSQEPEISNIIQESAFADFSFADIYYSGSVDYSTTIIKNINTWESATSAPALSSYTGIASGGGAFVAVSRGGSNEIVRSTDFGKTWDSISVPNATNILEITYGNGVFVGVPLNSQDKVIRSIDNGLTWTTGTVSEQNTWNDVAYGNGVFVAVAYNGTNRTMRSIDNGLSWSSVVATELNQWTGVTYGNGVFVAVAQSGTNRIMRSVDYGLSWSAVSAPEANSWNDITYGNGVFVAVATNGTTRIIRSVDNGVSWSSIVAPEANSWGKITYGNGIFYSVAYNGTNRAMYSEDDGLTWTVVATPEANYWNGITSSDGVFVAISYDGTNRAMHTVYEETEVPGTIYYLPAIAETYESSFFTIKITLYDTPTEDIWTVQNILRKIIAAGISYILVIQYTTS